MRNPVLAQYDQVRAVETVVAQILSDVRALRAELDTLRVGLTNLSSEVTNLTLAVAEKK